MKLFLVLLLSNFSATAFAAVDIKVNDKLWERRAHDPFIANSWYNFTKAEQALSVADKLEICLKTKFSQLKANVLPVLMEVTKYSCEYRYETLNNPFEVIYDVTLPADFDFEKTGSQDYMRTVFAKEYAETTALYSEASKVEFPSGMITHPNRDGTMGGMLRLYVTQPAQKIKKVEIVMQMPSVPDAVVLMQLLQKKLPEAFPNVKISPVTRVVCQNDAMQACDQYSYVVEE